LEPGNSYCHAVSELEDNHIHKMYHDYHYGFPIKNDNELFERLVLEINQAGLSWTTILKKQEHFRNAYDGFDIDKVAQYQEIDIARLLSDSGIIRNHLKIDAAIYNANVLKGIQKEHGSFYQWLEHHHPLSKEEWTRLFKKTFHFTGGEIVNEFLMSTGYLPGSHVFDCPIYQKTIQAGAAWTRE
jgi:DNA-3-methyladenine glycosylase I